MNKIQTYILVICIIITIVGIGMWNMPKDVQSPNLNNTTNNTIQNSNAIPLEKPPFLKEVKQ